MLLLPCATVVGQFRPVLGSMTLLSLPWVWLGPSSAEPTARAPVVARSHVLPEGFVCVEGLHSNLFGLSGWAEQTVVWPIPYLHPAASHP